MRRSPMRNLQAPCPSYGDIDLGVGEALLRTSRIQIPQVLALEMAILARIGLGRCLEEYAYFESTLLTTRQLSGRRADEATNDNQYID